MGFLNYLNQVEQKLLRIKELTIQINQEMERAMSTVQKYNDLVQQIDKATNAIATRQQKMVDQLNNATAGLSAEDAAAIATQLQAEIDRLNALGSDPANPVPPQTA